MSRRENINEFFNSRAFMILSALALAFTAVVALLMGVAPVATGGRGVFFSFDSRLLAAGPASAAINVLCLLATGGMMLALNKVFTFVRSTTHLFASAFFWLQVAQPQGLVAFNTGTLLCLVTTVATLPLFASFQDRHAQRSIFLIFALAATGCLFHYGFLVLIPAFLLGFINMGVFNLKGVLAMLFGLVTPFWITLGLGIASPAHFCAPDFVGLWHLVPGGDVDLLLALAAVTAVLGIVLAMMNMATIMNYRMQPRVYNAFFVFMLIAVVVAMIINYHDTAVLLPLLELMTAVQLAHAHTLRSTMPYRYMFVLLFVAGCIALGTVHLLMS